MRLADGIRTAIRDGRLRPAEALPSTRELAQRFRIHRHTVMHAVSELVAEGWIESQTRFRYRVMTTLPTKFLQPATATHRPPTMVARPVTVKHPADVSIAEAPAGTKFQFPSGLPDVRMLPMNELKSHMYDALSHEKNLIYSDPTGHERLKEQVSTYLRHLRGISGREVLITHGSQEAIFLLAQLLIKPGDNVAVEAMGYPPAMAALRFAGARLVPIDLDHEGLETEKLERLLKKKRITMLYLTPLHQYPTTVTMSAARRLHLYELACKYGFTILEDDYDHEFHYDSQPTAPLASFDPGELILYVSTFSKILFPSARIGFLAVPPALAREVAKLKRISSRQNETLLQDAIARWMESGGFERHLRRMRRAYGERRDAMIAQLQRCQAHYPRLNWTVPEGGMALWLDIGENSDRIAVKALERKVFVIPESRYRLDGKAGTHLRLGFSGFTPEENRRSLAALFP